MLQLASPIALPEGVELEWFASYSHSKEKAPDMAIVRLDGGVSIGFILEVSLGGKTFFSATAPSTLTFDARSVEECARWLVKQYCYVMGDRAA